MSVEVGRKYRIPCRDGIDTLTMYRDSENSVIYTQGDLERRLVFDNKGNIVVYSGTEKIDYGHTYPNKNREIRGKMLKAAHEVIEDTVAKVSRLEYMKELENTPKYERPELAYEVEPIVDVASIGDSN